MPNSLTHGGGGAPSRWLLALVAVLALPRAGSADPPPESLPVIPLPAAVTRAEGFFELTGRTVIVPAADPASARTARYLADLIGRTRPRMNLRVVHGAADAAPAIRFERVPGLAAEEYRLEVAPTGIRIRATSDAGLLYGAVTLWQLVPEVHSPTLRVPALSITDRPVYSWRGLMLDSARHYQSPEFIKRFIDGMALNKLNVLHWHLTDDQGWRLEIRRYPRLTSVGAFRVPAGRGAQADIDPRTGAPRRYGGFYPQATVRELVDYARDRNVTIVPEIEMPGHASAALAAYPELGVAPVRLDRVPADWGIYPHVYNISEATCRFLENVLAEVLELFPGRYVHVGGDEVQKTEWQHSPEVQARLGELGLADTKAVHGYLVQRMGRFLAAHGRRLVGWDEIIEPGLSTDATVMSWRGLEGALAAARRGNDTVLSPDPGLYLDHRQGTAPDEPPGRIAPLTLADVYAFDPLPAGLSPAETAHVLGLQANLWSEHVRTDERAALATFPRAAALAEVGWTPRTLRAWPDFRRRLGALGDRYRILGLPLSDSEFEVRASPRYEVTRGTVSVALATAGSGDVIRYTLDGTGPTEASTLYSGELELPTPAKVRAASFAGPARLSAPRSFAFTAAAAHRRSSHELELCSAGVALALEIDDRPGVPRPVVRLDVLDPCWIYKGVDLAAPVRFSAAVGTVPFNYQIGEAEKSIRVGDARSKDGELEIYLDSCAGQPLATVPLESAAGHLGVTSLPAVELPAQPGAHDLCLRFARPALDPIWVLDSVNLN